MFQGWLARGWLAFGLLFFVPGIRFPETRSFVMRCGCRPGRRFVVGLPSSGVCRDRRAKTSASGSGSARPCEEFCE
jgi:hypothetical protein